MKYTTDCFRKVANEDGTTEVKRWVEERPVRVQFQENKETGAKYWRGYRVKG